MCASCVQAVVLACLCGMQVQSRHTRFLKDALMRLRVFTVSE